MNFRKLKVAFYFGKLISLLIIFKKFSNVLGVMKLLFDLYKDISFLLTFNFVFNLVLNSIANITLKIDSRCETIDDPIELTQLQLIAL